MRQATIKKQIIVNTAILLLLPIFGTGVSLADRAEEVTVSVIVTRPPFKGGIPKTGQTIIYHDYDDGYYQMGNTASPRFTYGLDTVTDNATGLIWEQKTTDSSIHRNSYMCTWYNAFDDFLYGPEGLNTVRFANYDDWRIPNINEAYSIVDYSRSYPCIDLSIFQNVMIKTPNPPLSDAVTFYWVSTTMPDLTIYVPNCYYSYGMEGCGVSKDTAPATPSGVYVRAVRGGRGGLH